MNNQIKEHRKYLECCLNSRSVDAKMVATMTLNESRKNSKGFDKKILPFFETRRIHGEKVKLYVGQIAKNSLSKKNLKFLCRKLITRKVLKSLKLFGITSVVLFVFPMKSWAVDWGNEPLPFPKGLDPVTGRPKSTSSDVSCDLVIRSWYRACISAKNLFNKPTWQRQANCLAHTSLSCIVTAGVAVTSASKCLSEDTYMWAGVPLAVGGATMALAASNLQESKMFWTMEDWCDCGFGGTTIRPEFESLVCPPSRDAARAFLGSKSWLNVTRDWWNAIRENPHIAGFDNETLKLADDIIQAARNEL